MAGSEQFEQAAEKLLAMDAAIRAVLPQAAAAGAQPIKVETKERAPRGGTGDLAESVDDEPFEQQLHRAVHAVVVKKWYARYVEYGTVAHLIRRRSARVLASPDQIYGTEARHPGATAQPFLRPAADAKKQESGRAIEGVINGVIRRFVK